MRHYNKLSIMKQSLRLLSALSLLSLTMCKSTSQSDPILLACPPSVWMDQVTLDWWKATPKPAAAKAWFDKWDRQQNALDGD